MAAAVGGAWLWYDVEKKRAEPQSASSQGFSAEEMKAWNQRVRQEHPGARTNLHMFPDDIKQQAIRDTQAAREGRVKKPQKQ